MFAKRTKIASEKNVLSEPRRGELSEPRSGERGNTHEVVSNLFVTVHSSGFLCKICGRVGTATYRIDRIVAQIEI